MQQRRMKTQFFYDVEKTSLQKLSLLKPDPAIQELLVRLRDESKFKRQTKPKQQQQKEVNGVCRKAKQETCPSVWTKTHGVCYNIVSNKIFDNIITSIILLNTIVLTMYYHQMDPTLSDWLDSLNQVSVLFLCLKSL